MQFDISEDFLSGSKCYYVKNHLQCTRLVDGKDLTLWIPIQCIQSINLNEVQQDSCHFTITFTNNETSNCKARDYVFKQLSELQLDSNRIPFIAEETLTTPDDGAMRAVLTFAALVVIVLLLFKACSFIYSVAKDDDTQGKNQTNNTDSAEWYVKKGVLICTSKDAYEEEQERMGQNISELANGCSITVNNQRVILMGMSVFSPREVRNTDPNDPSSYWVAHKSLYQKEAESSDELSNDQTVAPTQSTNRISTHNSKSLSGLILPSDACSLLITQGLTASVMGWQTATAASDMAYSCSSQTPTDDESQINANGNPANYIEGSVSGGVDNVSGLSINEALHYKNNNNANVQAKFQEITANIYKTIFSTPIPHKVANAIAHKKNMSINIKGVPLKVQYSKWENGYGYNVKLIIGKDIDS